MPHRLVGASPASLSANLPASMPASMSVAEQTFASGPASSAAPRPAAPPALLDSQQVLQGQSAVGISHNGLLYRLQTTRQGKLILTK